VLCSIISFNFVRNCRGSPLPEIVGHPVSKESSKEGSVIATTHDKPVSDDLGSGDNEQEEDEGEDELRNPFKRYYKRREEEQRKCLLKKIPKGDLEMTTQRRPEEKDDGATDGSATDTPKDDSSFAAAQ